MKQPKGKKSKIWSLKKADDEFSLFIRKRDGKCARCQRPMTEDRPLTCSHFWGRQHRATRFDPNNCVALCWMPCHKYHWEKEKQGAYRDFMLKWLGKKEYDSLEKLAKTTYNQANAIIDLMRLLGKIE